MKHGYPQFVRRSLNGEDIEYNSTTPRPPPDSTVKPVVHPMDNPRCSEARPRHRAGADWFGTKLAIRGLCLQRRTRQLYRNEPLHTILEFENEDLPQYILVWYENEEVSFRDIAVEVLVDMFGFASCEALVVSSSQAKRAVHVVAIALHGLLRSVLGYTDLSTAEQAALCNVRHRLMLPNPAGTGSILRKEDIVSTIPTGKKGKDMSCNTASTSTVKKMKNSTKQRMTRPSTAIMNEFVTEQKKSAPTIADYRLYEQGDMNFLPSDPKNSLVINLNDASLT